MSEFNREHELKTDPEIFQAVWRGEKSFEIRLDDRDFKVGDRLLLRETKFNGVDMKAGSPLQYTGLEVQAEITYKLSGPIYGLAAGWCILSIERREPEPGQPAAAAEKKPYGFEEFFAEAEAKGLTVDQFISDWMRLRPQDFQQPVDMVLYCPNCRKQHIDAPTPCTLGMNCDEAGVCFAFANNEPGRCLAWTNPPHRSHLCAACGCIWRPADVATNGVSAIRTNGAADIWKGLLDQTATAGGKHE